MPVWLWLVEVLAMILVVLIGLLAALVVRRRALERSRGSFTLSVKRSDVVSPRGWRPGVALYRADEVQYFSLFSLAWRPKYRLRRGEVRVNSRREPVGQEVVVMNPGSVIIAATTEIGLSQLALSAQSLTGLLAWLEASPPGHGVSSVV